MQRTVSRCGCAGRCHPLAGDIAIWGWFSQIRAHLHPAPCPLCPPPPVPLQRYSDKLEILDAAACTPSSIELAWRPPTKNAERITSYKLMLASR